MNAGTPVAHFKGRKAYIYRLQNILPSYIMRIYFPNYE